MHVFCSRPEQPFFVQPRPDHVLVVYPIWLPTGASRAYTACFMQVRSYLMAVELPALPPMLLTRLGMQWRDWKWHSKGASLSSSVP